MRALSLAIHAQLFEARPKFAPSIDFLNLIFTLSFFAKKGKPTYLNDLFLSRRFLGLLKH